MRRVVPHSPPNVRAVTVTRPLWLGVLAALYSTAAQGVNLFTTILLQCKYFYDTLNLYQGTFTLQTCPFIKYIKLSVLHYLAFASGTCTNTAHKLALFIFFFFVICRFSAPMIMKCRPHIYTWSTLLLSDKKKKIWVKKAEPSNTFLLVKGQLFLHLPWQPYSIFPNTTEAESCEWLSPSGAERTLGLSSIQETPQQSAEQHCGWGGVGPFFFF